LEGVSPDTATFSPDGARFAVQHAGGAVAVHDLPSGRLARRFDVAASTCPPAFHPRRPMLAAAGHKAALLLDLETRTVRGRLPQHESAEGLAWHPGGGVLAVAGAGGRIGLWDVAARRQSRWLPGHAGGKVLLAFSRGGDWLASMGADNTLRLWDA